MGSFLHRHVLISLGPHDNVPRFESAITCCSFTSLVLQVEHWRTLEFSSEFSHWLVPLCNQPVFNLRHYNHWSIHAERIWCYPILIERKTVTEIRFGVCSTWNHLIWRARWWRNKQVSNVPSPSSSPSDWFRLCITVLVNGFYPCVGEKPCAEKCWFPVHLLPRRQSTLYFPFALAPREAFLPLIMIDGIDFYPGIPNIRSATTLVSSRALVAVCHHQFLVRLAKIFVLPCSICKLHRRARPWPPPMCCSSAKWSSRQ